MTAGAMTRMMAVTGLAAALAALPATTRAQEDGCPCLTEFPQALRESDLYNEAENCLYYEDGGVSYCYSLTYGLDQCAAHDEGLDPYCSALFPPDFCERNFCFVDSSCNSEPYASSYFPGYGLYYSYKTCGSINSFVAWSNQDVPRSMTDLIGLVEANALSAKQALEENVQLVRSLVESGSTSDCQLDSSCDGCISCEENTCWDQDINTRSTNVVLSDNLENLATEDEITELSCMAGFISSTYRRTAAKEYNDEGRIAYQYFGSQSTGAMVQWPASDFCSSSFDARQRPWYASAASGPKDIAIVIDVSGSMAGTRIELARAAAKAVLGTLTWVDRANIILFADTLKDQYASSLQTTTESRISDMSKWIDDNVVASGGTEFEDALAAAVNMLSDSAACSKAILFMTDGQDNSGFESGTVMSGVPSDVVIFSYALGGDASEAALQSMACETGGIFYSVSSESELPDVMSSYYEYFVQLADPCAVNWVQYTDAITGAELLGGCSAIFDTTANATVLQGVNCIDLNLIVDPAQLRTCSNNAYDSFVELIRRQAARCGALSSVGDCALAKLRAKAGLSSVCPGDSALETCGNTNIAFNATSCPAPDSNRFNDIILQGCQSEYKSCGKSDDGSAGSNIAALAGGLAACVVVLVVSLVVLFRGRLCKGSTKPASSSGSASSAQASSLTQASAVNHSAVPVAMVVQDSDDFVDVK